MGEPNDLDEKRRLLEAAILAATQNIISLYQKHVEMIAAIPSDMEYDWIQALSGELYYIHATVNALRNAVGWLSDISRMEDSPTVLATKVLTKLAENNNGG